MARGGRPADSWHTGEPSPPLDVSPTTVSPGDLVKIVLVGPPDGTATVAFTFIPAPPAAPADTTGGTP